ncbi:MAG TPA: AAA family ATPase [Gemmataceae bacterium]|nr:AAA family ATPase [Gemmataceae bacterium]
MISKVAIRNFKCLRDVEIDLERFTVFVGPNASGKTSILQAMDILCQIFRIEQPPNPQPNQRLYQLQNEVQQGLSRGATDEIELAAECGGKAYRYRSVGLSSQPAAPQVTQAARASYGRSTADSLAALEWKPLQAVQPGSVTLPLSILLRLEVSKLINPAPGNPNQMLMQSPDPTVMQPNGTGLHSALANMALNDPDSWQALQANLRQIIPSIRRLRHTKTAAVKQPAALLFDTDGADSLPANQVSEGTLLVLGLLAALHASDRPNLVLLDDLDRGLHPKAQKELIALLRGLLETIPDLQIIATTHSPYMLDCMGTDEVRMTFLRDDGATVCASLTSHPKYPKWKDEMTPGEMWSLFGEKWLVEEGVMR